MGLAWEENSKRNEDSNIEDQSHLGVKHLSEIGVTKVPNKYVLPIDERPNHNQDIDDASGGGGGGGGGGGVGESSKSNANLHLPTIDFDELKGSNRAQVLKSLSKACEEYGFFQVINHDIPCDIIRDMIDVSRRFFELPFEERAKHMSSDMSAPVRYGTSFNQNTDGVFCWRDFLKIVCHSMSDSLPHWPTSPADLIDAVLSYAQQTKSLFLMIMEAIFESLGLIDRTTTEDEVLKTFDNGSHLMVVNCYPPCPEPELTLGMPPHSDYGFLTLLLQDEVKGLQIQHKGKWITVEPIPNSFLVNIGDHLEIFSNGRYQSVLHRVLVNNSKSRISVASLHSMPYRSMVQPSPKLIDESNPKRYKDTDFAAFLEYVSTREPKLKSFLESRKLT